MTVICVSYIHYTHSLKIISYNIVNDFVHEAKFHGVEFSLVRLVFRKFQILEHFRVQIRDAQPVHLFNRTLLEPH
jgi:hypothetical protein